MNRASFLVLNVLAIIADERAVWRSVLVENR